MNNFLRLSIEGTLQNNLQAALPSNYSSLKLGGAGKYALSNKKPPKKVAGEDKALVEFRSFFKFWYQEVFHQTRKNDHFELRNQLLNPALGVILYRINQRLSTSVTHLRQLYELYHFVVDYHRFLYTWYDNGNEGLIEVPKQLKAGTFRVQDPLFNALLTWSNECLIKIGHQLDEDLSELLGWYELTIHSLNTKLWENSTGKYHYFLMEKNEKIKTPLHVGLSPLMGGIPIQEQSEKMVTGLSGTDLYESALRWKEQAHIAGYQQLNKFLDSKWMVQSALTRYEFFDLFESIDSVFDYECESYTNTESFFQVFSPNSGIFEDFELEISTL